MTIGVVSGDPAPETIERTITAASPNEIVPIAVRDARPDLT